MWFSFRLYFGFFFLSFFLKCQIIDTQHGILTATITLKTKREKKREINKWNNFRARNLSNTRVCKQEIMGLYVAMSYRRGRNYLLHRDGGPFFFYVEILTASPYCNLEIRDDNLSLNCAPYDFTKAETT